MNRMQKTWECRELASDSLSVSRYGTHWVNFDVRADTKDVMLNATDLDEVIAHLCAIRDEMRGEAHREAEAEAGGSMYQPGLLGPTEVRHCDASAAERVKAERVEDLQRQYNAAASMAQSLRTVNEFHGALAELDADGDRLDWGEADGWAQTLRDVLDDQRNDGITEEQQQHMVAAAEWLDGVVERPVRPEGKRSESVKPSPGTADSYLAAYAKEELIDAVLVGLGVREHGHGSTRSLITPFVAEVERRGWPEGWCEDVSILEDVPETAECLARDSPAPRRHHSQLAHVMELVQAEFCDQCARYGWPREIFQRWEFHGALPDGLEAAGDLAREINDGASISRLFGPLSILAEEVGEVVTAENPADRAAELIQVATVAMAWAASILDRERAS